MLHDEILKKQVLAMTGEEIIELFSFLFPNNQHVTQTSDFTKKKYVYGIKGLADLLKCGKTKAQEIKSSGLIDQAISQIGKKIIIDADKAIELLRNK